MNARACSASLVIGICLSSLAHAVLPPTPSYVVPPGIHTNELMGWGSDRSVALGGGFMVIGSQQAKRPTGATQTGGVYVFKTTGAFVRAIYPVDGVASEDFGVSLAITGNTLVVGAPGRSQPGGFTSVGAVYLYNLTTGAFIRRIDAPTPLNIASGWGSSVAADGDIVVVGGWSYDGVAGADTGGIFTHRISTNTTSAVVQGTAANQWLGRSVAIWKGLIVAGAPGSPGSDGQVRTYDAFTLSVQGTLTDTLPAGHAGRFGMSVAIDAERILVGAPESNGGGTLSGRVVLFRAENHASFPFIAALNGSAFDQLGTAVATKDQRHAFSSPASLGGRGKIVLTAPDFITFSTCSPAGSSGASTFGAAIALGRDGLLLASDHDLDAPTTNTGALWRAGPFLTENAKLTELAHSGESAAGAALTNYSTFTEICASASATTPAKGSYIATLRGAGASGGRSRGVWSTLALPNTPNPALGIQTAVSTGLGVTPFSSFATVSSVTRPIQNNDGIYFFKGVKAAGPSLFAFDSGNRLREMIAANTPLFAGAPVALTLHETRTVYDSFGFIQPLKLKLGTGTPVVTAASDSGLYAGGSGLTREGVTATDLPGTPLFGEISPRAACAKAGDIAYHAFVQTTGTPSAVFRNTNAIAVTGNIATNGAGAALPPSPTTAPVYSAFLGESTINNRVLFRATLKTDAGASVTTANNEGLWLYASSSGLTKLIVRKGDTISGTTLKWGRFLDYGVNHWGDVFVLAAVTGTGVTSANDVLLINLLNGDPASPLVVLQEGSAAPGCDGARIGVINQVDMVFTGSTANTYGALVTLVVGAGEATSANNLVWLTGDLDDGGAASSLYSWMPTPRLRKGERLLALPGRDTITSIAFPGMRRDGTGAGNTGMAHVLSRDQTTTAVIAFPDRSSALVTRTR